MAGRSIAGMGRGATLIAGLVIALAALTAALLFRHGSAVGPVVDALAPVAAIVAPAPPPPPPWTITQLDALLSAVTQSERQGLRPGDYDVDRLRQVVERRETGAPVDALATAAALGLAHDYAAGRVRNRHRFNWYIERSGPDDHGLADQLLAARQDGGIDRWLDGLLPTSPDYIALRDALAETPVDATRHDRIVANMERWRWLPRDFGTGDQLYINLPTYRVDVIRDGAIRASYKAVIGATDMPTPVLSAPVRQVIVNPDWIVPQSIVRKSHMRPGVSSRYVFTTRPDGTLRVRQKPGAGNALGKVKIEFPNRLAIYFHDTPSRSLFGASTRTFSHGCVRVQNVDALGASLVADRDRFATALAGSQTRGFPVAARWHADIVYLTLVRGDDGTLSDVGDPYKADEPLAAAIAGRKPQIPPPVITVPTKPAVAKPVMPATTTTDPLANAATESPAATDNQF